MNVLVLGATGGTGRALVEQALALGYHVTAFARDPKKIQTKHENLQVAQGDVLKYVSVEAAVAGQDAVLSALGFKMSPWFIVAIVVFCQFIPRMVHAQGILSLLVRIGLPLIAIQLIYRGTTLSEGTRNIVRAMDKNGVKRFICESSLGIGDSHGQLGIFYNFVMIPLLLRNIFADKEVQEDIIKNSDLDWVIVRPGVLTNGPHTASYRAGFATTDHSIRARVSRADVADFMLRQVTNDTYLRQTPGLSD